jgi:hypothetical protein
MFNITLTSVSDPYPQLILAESLDRKCEFHLASGYCFFCLKHDFVITMGYDVL